MRFFRLAALVATVTLFTVAANPIPSDANSSGSNQALASIVDMPIRVGKVAVSEDSRKILPKTRPVKPEFSVTPFHRVTYYGRALIGAIMSTYFDDEAYNVLQSFENHPLESSTWGYYEEKEVTTPEVAGKSVTGYLSISLFDSWIHEVPDAILSDALTTLVAGVTNSGFWGNVNIYAADVAIGVASLASTRRFPKSSS
ncbi:hypothetical protein BGZ83_008089 [Gryganskiella cystojenkinii]|nr:hypothetical protein BGZ83_008089 [Gryganskiella cystojenkinii]